MSSSPKSHAPHGEGPGRHEGTEQHGWSPDVDSTHTQDNPSARRSFDKPRKSDASATGGRHGGGQKAAKEDDGTTVESDSRRGEDIAKKGQEGHHDMGTRGRSKRPSGGKDASAYTGVDPKS
ncbi:MULTISPECIES: hypothetical protein [unclassified Streptomyces]|uniref:hypothetical protein n=1 Tax=Streptomyces sp. NRRL F-4428 TaxID=1609137 RepID=UPI0004AA25BE|nr:hypothetical protein [Streptomyces sp. NRRL F-4428]KJK52592.1 hypothetical protein UK14_08125 [Streptomyces sp. NRRL F-4428]